MLGLGWLTRELGEVPPDDEWLSERECATLSALRAPKRRAEWRLGRWAAKAAVAAWRGVEIELVEVAAAADGSPTILLNGAAPQLALSLSHRKGRALAAVGDGPIAVGCDLEAIEPRSPAFMREWLSPTERELLGGLNEGRREIAANLFWTAKEAASKARRGGLRLNLRRARAEPSALEQPPGSWAPLRVAWEGGSFEEGWWRWEPGWVMSVLSDPASGEPPSKLR